MEFKKAKKVNRLIKQCNNPKELRKYYEGETKITVLRALARNKYKLIELFKAIYE